MKMYAQYIKEDKEHPQPAGVKEVSVFLGTDIEIAKKMGNVEMDVTRVGDRYYETGYAPKGDK